MAVYRRFVPNIQSAFSVVIMIVVWLAFAPLQVGGSASYIVVIGKSMEPNFHIGDLVIVHEQPIYQIGDAIVYRNVNLENYVFHRIISQQLRRYQLKGDNNSWVDTYQPSSQEIIGKLWLHIPRAGIAIQKIRSPFVMALIAGALGAVLAASLFTNKAKGNKRMNNKSTREWFTSVRQRIQGWLTTNDPKPAMPLKFGQGETLEGLFFVLGLVAFSSLILGMIAFSRPASRLAQDDINYEQLGIFSYSASTPYGVYDANTIKSGDPIFTKLSCAVDVNFQYTLVAGRTENIAGTYQLTAIISEQVSGWQRIVPLQDEASFAGTAFGTTAKLDLCKMEALTQSMEQQTASHPGSYLLAVEPNIKLNGTLSGHTLESTFNPTLVFRYDRIQYYLVRNEEVKNPLVFAETGMISQQHEEPNTMLLLGRQIAIPALRLIALLGLIASGGGLVLLGLQLQHLSQRNQEKFFHIRYSSMMIDVQNGNSLISASLIDVTSMDALAKLAERFSTLILHTVQDDLHTYYVQAGGTTYRFVINTHKPESIILEGEGIGQESGA